MNDNIKMINRKLLMPHPDNPRKDLGDLKELADSIAEHGIMQNLTVVPEGNMYKILIGHRRYAASEGVLDELPCVVVNNLTYAQQVGVMLAENMQRADLTYIESEIKGEVHYSLNNNRIKVATYKEPKSKKGEEDREKARKEAEKLKKKNKAALREIRADICDAYMDFIQNSEVDLTDPQKELGNVYLLLDLCREFEMGVTLYMLTAEKVRYQLHDKLSLKGYNKEETFKDFESWTPLFQLLANIWWSLASSYNYFEDYECRPHKEILEAHKSFCNILKDIDGFRIKEEWKPVLDGTSELYIKEGK